MKTDGGGAGGEWAGVGADDALSEVGDLQALVREVAFDELGHRPIEEHVLCFFVGMEAVFDLFA